MSQAHPRRAGKGFGGHGCARCARGGRVGVEYGYERRFRTGDQGG
ncbi:hypothetical protein I314_04781 [Cryptococcus bacillisporus CA1873]|uniref:Uncharacterized protein n=2 Tax=Cryptococcus gattii TaxID=552467 RepID=A0A0D0VEH2_CRYGA|nr:hypothetical protein I312_05907 [Cryptococcus bacillisporus CA1280]KIR59266.1 hypothetical protein I314_04781 [Cryptococcus bacillisporus CA1873]|eukprot:KIR59266.1 hypothetical protein I314_04781 [Cryptococcus gattii CA1873]